MLQPMKQTKHKDENTMAKKKPEDTIIVKPQQRHLMCTLTEEELADAAQAMARYDDDGQALEDDFAVLKQQFKAKLDQCRADFQAKKRLVREKKELRPTDVVVSTNYTTGRLTAARPDTGEIIEDRKLQGEEKQMKVPFANQIDKAAETASAIPTGGKAA